MVRRAMLLTNYKNDEERCAMTNEKMRLSICEVLDTFPALEKQEDGTYAYEIYADYRDEASYEDAMEILNDIDPDMAFWNKLDKWYIDYQFALLDELEGETRKRLTSSDGPYPCGFTDEESNDFTDLMTEMILFNLPQNHYLQQKFFVPIMVDTGDGNYDFVLNTVYPAYCGPDDDIDDKASIVWLAKTQGYTKEICSIRMVSWNPCGLKWQM